jgi:hypothetical protein
MTEEEANDSILEALSYMPESINNQDIVTMIVLILDGYGIDMLDAMEILQDANYTYAAHSLTQGYDPFRPC